MRLFAFACGVPLLLAITARAGQHGTDAAAAPRSAPAFHVAVGGDDANPGTEAAPFATLAGARDAVRERIRDVLTDDVVVEIHGGRYGVS